MIQVDSLEFAYNGIQILQGLSFEVPEATSYAIVGASGCGKSTLLHLLAGVLRPDSGSIRVAGKPLAGTRDATALVLQDGGLLPWKRAVDNAALSLLARGVPAAVARDRAYATLGSLDVVHRATAYPAAMSGGEIQRTALARALLLEPDLLLADEASASLDAIVRERIQDLLLRLFSERSLTMVVVTHSIEEAVSLGQRIAVMADGRIHSEIANPAFAIQPDRFSEAFTAVCAQVRRGLLEAERA
jgi:NitT/TauT family transport system ATP-binding protein